MTEAEETLAALREATEAVRRRAEFTPRTAVILGTGLSALAREIEPVATIPYEELPHFPLSTVESHAGRLILGLLGGAPVVAMQGRFHRYEGYTLQQIAAPVRVMRLLGASTLIVSNACGAMNPLWSAGELMLIDDHINFLGDNPLIGPNLDELGPRFPDMSRPYDRELQQLAESVAMEQGIPLRRGVYVAVQGPNLETRAEYRMLRTMGGDVVGMSTVPEVIVARHMGMRVLGISVITDVALPDALQETTLEEILRAAAVAEPKLAAVVKGVVERLSMVDGR